MKTAQILVALVLMAAAAILPQATTDTEMTTATSACLPWEKPGPWCQ
ncbi:hypothetical protein [Micromonospora chalcea]